MDFKKLFSSVFIVPFIFVVLVIAGIIWKSSQGQGMSSPDNIEAVSPVKNTVKEPVIQTPTPEDLVIQEELNHDRQAQKQTRYLKTKLEQSNLELEEEKTLSLINKLKLENIGALKEPFLDGPKELPQIKVEYIGGDSLKKEAILAIGGTNYQVKERSTPTDQIQVVSITDSSVTLHFSAPKEMNKTIAFKPE